MDKTKNILIIGANSDIAKQCALIWARRMDNLVLASRDVAQLQKQETELLARGAGKIKIVEFDATVRDDIHTLFEDCVSEIGNIDLVLIAHGVLLSSESEEAKQLEPLEKFLYLNGLTTVLMIRKFMNEFSKSGKGHIAVISSIAGDRARPSNLEYGLSKQIVNFYMDGLRKEARESGVKLTLIKPGLIRTKMTDHLKDGMLFTSSRIAGRCIVKGIDANKFQFYVPAYWRLVSVILKLIPYKILAKLNV